MCMEKDKTKNYIIEKSNPILEARNDMTFQQLRFFNIYLAFINPLDENTKRVSLPLQKISNLLKVELNEQAVRKMGQACMQLYIDLADYDKEAKKRGAMRLRHMFQRFDVDKNESGVWMVTMQADEDILPYLFDIKAMGYLKYSLYNVLTLDGKVQIKLYEVLKLGQGLKNYTLALDDLKERLGVSETKSYTAYKKFKQAVLDRCLKEINEKTDIKASYEEIRGPGRGRPVNTIKFHVLKNPDWIDPLNVKCIELPGQVPEQSPEMYENLNPELQSYADAVPEKVRKSKKYDPAVFQKAILAAFPEDTISQQLMYLKIATTRYIPRESSIKNHYNNYYLKILQSVLEEKLKEAENEKKQPEKKNNAPRNSFMDFEQRDYDYDALLRQINNMPQKDQ